MGKKTKNMEMGGLRSLVVVRLGAREVTITDD